MVELNPENKNIFPKKFVFHVRPEHINFIESLTYQEKHELINVLLSEYRKSQEENANTKEKQKQILQKIYIFLIAIFVIPLIFMLINFSINLTQNSYSEMENNFKQLYANKKHINKPVRSNYIKYY